MNYPKGARINSAKHSALIYRATFSNFQPQTIENEIQKIQPIKEDDEPILVSYKELRNMGVTEIPMLFEGLFPKVGIVSIAGDSGSGKSSIGKQMCISVAANDSHFGSKRINATHFKSLYVPTEESKIGMAATSTKNARDYSDEQIEGFSIMFNRDNLENKLKKLLKRTPHDLIVIDTYLDVFDGDSNSVTNTRSFLDPFHKIAEEFQCLIIFIHHCSKGKEDFAPSKNSLMGSQGFEGKMRVVAIITKDTENSNKRYLSIVKVNDIPEQEYAIVYNYDGDTRRFTETDEKVLIKSLGKSKLDKEEPTFTVDPDKLRWRKAMIVKATGGTDSEICKAAGCRDMRDWYRLELKAEKQDYLNSQEW